MLSSLQEGSGMSVVVVLIMVAGAGLFSGVAILLVRAKWKELYEDDYELDEGDVTIPVEESALKQSQRLLLTPGSVSNTIEIRNRTIFTQSELTVIGWNLISIFRQQAKSPTKECNQKHFAVVYLALSKEHLLNLHQDGFMKTDNSRAVMPSDNQFTRYITARPDDQKCHAEDLIMQKFHKLVQAFELDVKYIVLFSWLFPCKDCASKISATIRQLFHKDELSVSVVVMYCRIRPEEKSQRKYVRQLLKSEQIYLKHIRA